MNVRTYIHTHTHTYLDPWLFLGIGVVGEGHEGLLFLVLAHDLALHVGDLEEELWVWVWVCVCVCIRRGEKEKNVGGDVHPTHKRTYNFKNTQAQTNTHTHSPPTPTISNQTPTPSPRPPPQ